MKIAVICALEQEIKHIAERLENVKRHDGFAAVTEGTAGGHTLYVAISGIGKTCAAAATQHLLERFGCEAVINIGLAGGCEGAPKRGGAVVADSLAFHDFDLRISETFSAYFGGFLADARLKAAALDACRALSIECVEGTVATGDVFVSDELRKDDIVARTGCSCVDMEGAAVALVALLNKKPFASIKIISDSADDSAEQDFLASLDKFAKSSAAIVVAMAERL